MNLIMEFNAEAKSNSHMESAGAIFYQHVLSEY